MNRWPSAAESDPVAEADLAAHEAATTNVHGTGVNITSDNIASYASGAADASTTVKGVSKLSVAPATGSNPIAVGDNDPRNADQRTPVDGSVTAAKVNTALKPSGSAATSDEALRALGSGSTQAAAGDDSRFPSAGQKNALAGSSGTPGTTNKYVTDQDARNTDTRIPADASVTDAKIATTLSPSKITGTAVVTADARLSDTRTPTDASVTDAKIATTLSPAKITGTAVVTADSRLSDNRTPSDASVTDAKIATTLSPSKITGTAVVTADSRLSDTRTPTDATVTPAKFTATTKKAIGKSHGQTGFTIPHPSAGVTNANQALSAQRAFCVRFTADRDYTLALISFIVSTAAGANDNVDVGIYDSTLTSRLASAGATAGKLNSTGIKSVTIAASLVAGTTYYAALLQAAVTSGAATLRGFNYNNVEQASVYGTTAGLAECLIADGVGTALPANVASFGLNVNSSGPLLYLRES